MLVAYLFSIALASASMSGGPSGDLFGAIVDQSLPAISLLDDSSLTSKIVLSFTFSERGVLYAGTAAGLGYDAGAGLQPLRFPPDVRARTVRALAADREMIYAGTQGDGVVGYDERLGRFVPQPFPRTGAGANVEAIATSGLDGRRLWVGTQGGLYCRTGASQDVALLLAGKSISVVQARPSADEVWAATDEQLLRFSACDASPLTQTLPSSVRRIRSLHEINGRLYVGTMAGLWVARVGSHDVSEWEQVAPDLLGSRFVRSVMHSGEGADAQLWIGLYGAGLVRLGLGPLRSYGVQEGLASEWTQAVIARGSFVFVGSDEGASRVRTGGGFRRLRGGPVGKRIRGVQIIEAGEARGLWASTETAVYFHDGLGWRERDLRPFLGDDVVQSFHKAEGARPERLFVGTFHGRIFGVRRHSDSLMVEEVVPRFPYSNESIFHIEGGDQLLVGKFGGLARLTAKMWSADSPPPGGVDATVTDVAPLANGALLLSTFARGLLLYRDGLFADFADGIVPRRTITALARFNTAAQNGLLAATAEGALWFTEDQKLLHTFSSTRYSDMRSDYIESIFRDGDGPVYLGTDGGVVRFTADGSDFRFASFGLEDGLPSLECVQKSGAVDARGRLWIGTAQGIAVLDSRGEIFPNDQAPLLLDRVVAGATAVDDPGRVQVPYEGNHTRFSFNTRSFFRQRESRFRTQLVGVDKDASDWNSENYREFSGLGWGHYTLKIWARDYQGREQGPISSALWVQPPWWGTYWAYASYLAGIVVVTLAASRARVRQLQKRANDLEETVSKRTEEVRKQAAEILAQKEALELSYKEADRIFDALKLALKGSLLGGEYRLDQEIGQGGFGVVYRASEVRTGKLFAVKVFRPQSGNDSSEALERFKREGRSGIRFKHPHAIDIYKFAVTDDGVAYMVMELLSGRSLKEELESSKQLPFARCQQVLGPVCEALAAAHLKGILHRDIKPDNIFLHQEDGREVVKVLDFGVAKLTQPQGSVMVKTLTLTGAVVGTPSYMAPERLEAEDYDGRSDIYSVGVVMYEMLAGRPPFLSSEGNLISVVLAHINKAPEPVTNFADNVPRPVQDMVSRTLAKVPDERPTASELAEWLRTF